MTGGVPVLVRQPGQRIHAVADRCGGGCEGRRCDRDFSKIELSHRTHCRQCGGPVLTLHPPLDMMDVFAATLPELAFVPEVHLNYAETVLPIRDGPPKLKDFSAEFGGSGGMLRE